MQIIEVTNPRDARLARFAQYGGYDRTLKLSDQTLSGVVVSVSPCAGILSEKWIIKFKPTPERKPIPKRTTHLYKR